MRKIRSLRSLPDDPIFCTIDVVGLYPNIPHEEGLEAIGVALDSREDKRVSTESILELAQCVLKNNYFEHNEKVYKQLRGTAIGTKFAPSYAILFMAELEERILSASPDKPFVWWRYIDDVFMIWQHGEEKLKAFLESLNSFHPTIKFTYEYSKESINFLDVQLTHKEGQLSTDLYVKPTDTHQYLEASSCHVFHAKKSIPYSQALRLNRICSNPLSFDKRCDQLESWLFERGYSKKLVRDQILKARKISRDEALSQKPKANKEGKLTLNLTYHPAFSNIKTILNFIHLLLTPDREHRKVFEQVPIVGFKKGKSLKDLLVRARIRENKVSKCTGCKDKRCEICDFIEPSSTFQDKEGKFTYNIRGGDLNCKSKNVIYLVNCKTCKTQYVGSTTKFRSRFNDYVSKNRKFEAIKDLPKDDPDRKEPPQMEFHSHFNEEGHNGRKDWAFQIIEKVDDLKLLRKRESFWQHKLNTFEPEGLNVREVAIEV